MYGTRGRRLTATAVAALLSLTLAACGDTEKTGDKTTTGTGTTSADPAPTEAPQGQLGREFTADPGIVNPHPLQFDSWTRLADDKIAVNFTTGSPECYGVDVTTTETAKSVTIALRSGTRADAVGRMCTMIAVFGSLQIQLKSPLGDREVLSGK
ncbi:hypothetical protein OHB26_15485 [Nocardia sp. NBC_01503]|uniref:hypothetical protein n=1 Tax=Nocardia sp. NBC_01503 TaxID=2975997 RepID=UPI002E7B2020|nr:hypothetical protein [Nocardia sp. NBC_01503]WTL35470.1 hypothetical protein OHB26_15485 [Nocardia sp. NBC_01503]